MPSYCRETNKNINAKAKQAKCVRTALYIEDTLYALKTKFTVKKVK